MRRPSIGDFGFGLRAGVPQAVVAEIGSRRRIVGLVGLHAVGVGILANRCRNCRYNGRIIVVVGIIVAIGVVVIAGPAIGVARGERAADHGAGNRAGEEPAVAITVAAVPASVAAAITRDGWPRAETRAGCGAAPARGGRTAGADAAISRHRRSTWTAVMRHGCRAGAKARGRSGPSAAHGDAGSTTPKMLGRACGR